MAARLGELAVALVAVDRFVPGIYVGSHLAARVPDKILRPMLAATLLLVGMRMLRL